MENASLTQEGDVYIHTSDIQNTLESGRGRRPSDIEEIPEDQETTSKTRSRPKLSNPRLLGRRRSEQRDGPAPSDRQTRSATPAKQDEGKSTGNTRKKRGSINLQVRRPTTQPEFSTNANQQRRMSVRRNTTMPAPPTQAFTNSVPHAQTRRASTAPKTKEPEPALTDEQKDAFKEAFDLFDSNGGGTISAEELTIALSSVDIHLSVEEIKEVLQAIDKDGSGEIDFEEFLNMMTNTEKFLEMFASKQEGPVLPAAGRGHILFDALTQFMRSSALKAMDEIVGYYKNKYRRVNTPHVVMHYAAGARLIGLTEKQLARHLEKLQASNQGNDLKSPYAQPLRIFLTGPTTCTVKKKEPADQLNKEHRRCTGKIRLTVHLPPSNDGDIAMKTEDGEGQSKTVRNSLKNKNTHVEPVFQPRLGWVKPHVKSIAARLPKRKSVLTMEDFASIRKRVTDATRDHFNDRARSRAVENQRYWRSLQPQFIPSKTLRTNFRKVFSAYIAAGQRQI